MNQKRQIRGLLVDDDEEDYMLARDLLSEIEEAELILDWAATYEEGLAAIQKREHDVYIVDHHLGARTGLELLRQAVDGGCEVPIIMLTGKGDHELEKQAIQAGAVDYVDKSDVMPWLELAVRHALDS